jgi:hypothetical protein
MKKLLLYYLVIFYGILGSSLCAQKISINLRFQHQICAINTHNKERDCTRSPVDKFREVVEFDLSNQQSSTVKLVHRLGYALVTLSRNFDTYSLYAELFDLAGPAEQHESFNITNIASPSHLEATEYAMKFYDYEWDFENKSSRSILFVGGETMRPIQSEFDRHHKSLKALLEGDPRVSVKNIGFDENGFLVRITTTDDHAQALANLFSGTTFLSNFRPLKYALTRYVCNTQEHIIKPQPYPHDTKEEAELFAQAFSKNPSFARAYDTNNMLVIEANPLLLEIDNDHYSAEKVYEDFLYATELQNIFTRIPLDRKIQVNTKKTS